MKRFLILGYIFSVLLVAGFARADETTQALAIKNINYQEGSWQIQVIGPLPNLCVLSPQPTLEPSRDAPTTLILRMMAKSTAELCGQAVRGNYNVPVDLRRLLVQSGIKLRVGETYTIKAEGYPFEVSFEGPLSLYSRGNVVELSGMLMRTKTGALALFTNENSLVLVDSSLVDCRPFINTHISVVGHFGPLQTADTRKMLPSREQQSRLTQRLTIVEITSADR
jgi:hypothetical protein